MKKLTQLLLTISLFVLTLFLSCNPECQSLQNVKISTSTLPSGHELKITSEPISSLRGKKVSFGGVEAATRFVDNFGLIVKVPAGVSGASQLQIESSDCLEVINYDFNVVNMDFFSSVANFSPPITPEIIIPQVPPFFPAFIDQAWLSPDFQNYCLWFGMNKIINPDSSKTETSLIDPNGSFELSVCSCKDNEVYSTNPISGIVDKVNNNIHIFIDRTSKGGDIEEFTGVFIDKSKSPYSNFSTTFDCNCPITGTPPSGFPTFDNAPLTAFNEYNMMLLTSVKTGRQLAVYQKIKQ
jgi:hypothetical protein